MQVAIGSAGLSLLGFMMALGGTPGHVQGHVKDHAQGHLQGAPATSGADAAWARAARARYWQDLGENATEFLCLEPATRMPESEQAGRMAAWPFDGFAPHPSRFPAPAVSSTRPAATVEWRRSASGEYLESHVEGAPELVELARATRRDASMRHASGPGIRAEPWSRHAEVPAAFDPAIAAEADWHPGIVRAYWCSAWTDCYAIDATGAQFVVTVDPAAGWSELRVAHVDGTVAPEVHRFEDPAYFTLQARTVGALLLVADLDANGTRDHFFASIVCGNRTCGIDGAFALTSPDGRRTRFSAIESDRLGLIDLDGNRRAEILSSGSASVARCTDGRPHNFVVTQLLGFQDLGVVDLRGVHAIRHGDFVGRFPAFEWLAFDPKERFRPLLTEAQRREFGATPHPPYRRPASSIR